MTDFIGLYGDFAPLSSVFDAEAIQFLSIHAYPYSSRSGTVRTGLSAARFYIAPMQYPDMGGRTMSSIFAIDATGQRQGINTALVYNILDFPNGTVHHTGLDATGAYDAGGPYKELYYVAIISGMLPDKAAQDLGTEWTTTFETLDMAGTCNRLGCDKTWDEMAFKYDTTEPTFLTKRLVVVRLPEVLDLPSTGTIGGDGAVVVRQIKLPELLRFSAFNFDYVSFRVVTLVWSELQHYNVAIIDMTTVPARILKI